MKILVNVGLLALFLILVSCSMSDSAFKKQLTDTLKENPEVLSEAFDANPIVIMDALQNAARKAQEEAVAKREDDEKKKFEEAFENPLAPDIRKDEAIKGPKDAPITVVEYSDFECPFCSRGYAVIEELMKKYAGKIRLVYKHLPLSFHQQAMPAATYFEGIRMQDSAKAFKFYDLIFANQKDLAQGDAFLKKMARQVGGVDMNKLARDIKSEAVKTRIEADMAEAAKFDIQGTPGFILNGVPIRGAYPISHFESIIDQLKEKGKLKI